MNDKTSHLQPITILERTGGEPYIDTISTYTTFNTQPVKIKYRPNGTFSDADTRKYVDYLLQVVLGSIPQEDEIITQANEQLLHNCRFARRYRKRQYCYVIHRTTMGRRTAKI